MLASTSLVHLAFARVRSLVPPDPPLEDADLVLRPSVESDAGAIRKLYSEPDVRRWMGWDAELPDEADALANIERAAQSWNEGSWAVFRIVDAATDRRAGIACLARRQALRLDRLLAACYRSANRWSRRSARAGARLAAMTMTAELSAIQK